MSFSKVLNGLLILIVLFLLGQYIYKLPRFDDGEKAPAFEATLLDGASMSLEELKGNYVLIDFWGSWCGPCRAENPQLVSLYSKYKGRSFENAEAFEIVSIGIEQRKERWLRAIKKDQLDWKYHILDQATNLRFFDSPIAGVYGITEVPSKYLIDPRGNIIGVNPSVEEVDQLLSGHLASN